MPSIAVRKRLFTTAQLSSIVGRVGEITVDIDKNTIVIHDGTTGGGIPLAIEAHDHPLATTGVKGFMSAADKTALDNHIGSTDGHPVATQLADGFLSAGDKAIIDGIGAGGGSLPAWSSANNPNELVLRDSNGDFAAGTITAETQFVGNLQGNADTATNGVVTTGSYNDPPWITALAGSKITGDISGEAGSVEWTNVLNRPTNVSEFTNDVPYVSPSGTVENANHVVGETAGATPNTVILRDSAARAKVASPAVDGDIANKAYVDAASGGSQKVEFTGVGQTTWTVPNGVNQVFIAAIGAGGGGGGANTVNYGGGGGGGMFFFGGPFPVFAGRRLRITVGGGGVGGNFDGFDGGDSIVEFETGIGTGIYSEGITAKGGKAGLRGSQTTGGLGGGQGDSNFQNSGALSSENYNSHNFGFGVLAPISLNLPGNPGRAGSTPTTGADSSGGAAGGALNVDGTTSLDTTKAALAVRNTIKPFGAGDGGTENQPGKTFGGGGSGGAVSGGNGRNGAQGKVLIFY